MDHLMKKELPKKLLFELLKDSKRSDRELSKALGVSQPTVTRRRNQLVAEGIIREFTVIPDFTKMGYELMAITCFKTQIREELHEKAREVAKAVPNIIFLARGHGKGMNGILISLHKNYTDYSRFISDLLAEGGAAVEDHDSFLISFGDLIVKPLSLSYLTDADDPAEV